ncbi:MAG: prepilin-type N-terminal cleavage/methylation domain-containing protein [Candidatus Omnitrophota bacterium]
MLNRRGFSAERLAYSKKKIFSSYLSAKGGFTLVELFIAITLVGMVFLSITAVDIVSRKFLNTTYYESRVQNEVGPILEMIAKDIARGYGNLNNPGVIVSTPNTVDIRQLDAAAAPTYDDFSDDSWVRYSYEAAPNYRVTRQYCTAGSQTVCGSWGTSETLANNISGCSFTIADDAGLNKNLWVAVVITARRNAADSSPPSATNPEVVLRTTIAARSQPIR